MTATIIGPGGQISVTNEVEVKNDQGNALPVSLDLTLAALRDALRGVSNKTLTDIVTAFGAIVVSNMIPAVETGLMKDATFTSRLATQSRVYQVLAGLQATTETAKVDIKNNYGDAAGSATTIYKAFCPNGATDNAATHDVVRVDLGAAGTPTKIRFLSQIRWDTRAGAAWP